MSRGLIIKGFIDLATEFKQFTLPMWPVSMGRHLCPRCLGLSSHDAESETEFQRQGLSLGSDPMKNQDTVCMVWVYVFHMQSLYCPWEVLWAFKK